MTEYVDTEAYLSERLGMPVVVTDLLPEGTMLIGALGHGAVFWEPIPDEPRWEAVDIVQRGLADVVRWLREAGHHIPDWQSQKRWADIQETVEPWCSYGFESGLMGHLEGRWVVDPDKVLSIENVS